MRRRGPLRRRSSLLQQQHCEITQSARPPRTIERCAAPSACARRAKFASTTSCGSRSRVHHVVRSTSLWRSRWSKPRRASLRLPVRRVGVAGASSVQPRHCPRSTQQTAIPRRLGPSRTRPTRLRARSQKTMWSSSRRRMTVTSPACSTMRPRARRSSDPLLVALHATIAREAAGAELPPCPHRRRLHIPGDADPGNVGLSLPRTRAPPLPQSPSRTQNSRGAILAVQKPGYIRPGLRMPAGSNAALSRRESLSRPASSGWNTSTAARTCGSARISVA